MKSFIFGGDTGETPESLARKRAIAEALLSGAMSRAPRDVGEGLTAIGQALGGRIADARVNKLEAGKRSEADSLFNSKFGGVAAALLGGSPSVPSEVAATSPAPAPVGDPSYRDAIASIESKGSGDYSAIGPTNPKLGRALGRYQIMEANIGPWSKEALGREVTPEEFLANPGLQDQIFDKKFGGYVQQYGPEGAAQAWFGGPGAVGKGGRKDVLGTTVAEYGNRFMAGLGGGQEPASLAAQPGMAQTASPALGYAGGATMDAPMVVYDKDGMRTERPTIKPEPGNAPYSGPGAQMNPPMAVYDRNGFRTETAAPKLPAPVDIPSADISPMAGMDSRVGIARALAGMPGREPGATGAFPPAPGQEVAQGLDINSAIDLMNNPYLPEGKRAVLKAMIERELSAQQARQEQMLKQSDPAYKIGLEKSQIELDRLKNPKSPWQKLDDDTLFRPDTGETKEIGQPAPQTGFRFTGNSVEAQALNGLIDTGKLTAEQAQQLAAGKTITGPNGEIIFMTPQGVFSKPGAQPQAGQGIDLFGERSAQPAQAAPANPGNIQITEPKVTLDEKKAMTFADRMTTSGALIDGLEEAGLGSKDNLIKNNGWIPDILENKIVSEDFQKYDQARRDFINAQLRRESGAVISPEEFDNANKQYFPQPGDTEDVLKQKRENRRIAIEGMIRDGGPTYARPKPRQDNGAGPPSGIEPEVWDAMTPEEKRLWQN